MSDNRPEGPPAGPEPTASQFSASIILRIWHPSNRQRHGRLVVDPGVLPLRKGEQIRIEVSIEPPAYPYLVWIKTDGSARPLYPWKLRDWYVRVQPEQAVGQLAFPKDDSTGWPVSGGSGIRTVCFANPIVR